MQKNQPNRLKTVKNSVPSFQFRPPSPVSPVWVSNVAKETQFHLDGLKHATASSTRVSQVRSGVQDLPNPAQELPALVGLGYALDIFLDREPLL